MTKFFFSYETKLYLSPFLKDSIRLSKKNQEKLKEGNTGAYEPINWPQKKFEKSVSILELLAFMA